MMSTVEDILDISRMQFNHFEIKLEWFYIGDIVDEVLEILEF